MSGSVQGKVIDSHLFLSETTKCQKADTYIQRHTNTHIELWKGDPAQGIHDSTGLALTIYLHASTSYLRTWIVLKWSSL